MNKYAIILAAGKGTRMHSSHPKVTHKILGKPMIQRVLQAVDGADIIQKYVVIGHGAEEVSSLLDSKSKTVLQEEQLGTGHAVMTALKAMSNVINSDREAIVLVTCGDTPLIRAEHFNEMILEHIRNQNVVTVMTAESETPKGYGRIVRKGNQISQIIEEKDASEEEKKIKEINAGTYCFNLDFLVSEISKLDTNNQQGEFYLTDLLRIGYDQGKNTGAYLLNNIQDSLGVNNRVQLAQADMYLRQYINESWMMKGVTMYNPSSIFIDDEVVLEEDVILEDNVHLEGTTIVRRNAYIESGSRIRNSEIGAGAHIKQSVITNSTVGERCTIGPFAQLRPKSQLANDIKIGNFVEIKNSTVANESKISHHTYIGDSDIGERVNVGCGTITCNYDGKNKFRTKIGDDAFIGSNTNLIAPIEIGKGVLVGAGSTLSKDVDEYALAVTRPKLIVKENWTKEKGNN